MKLIKWKILIVTCIICLLPPIFAGICLSLLIPCAVIGIIYGIKVGKGK